MAIVNARDTAGLATKVSWLCVQVGGHLTLFCSHQSGELQCLCHDSSTTKLSLVLLSRPPANIVMIWEDIFPYTSSETASIGPRIGRWTADQKRVALVRYTIHHFITSLSQIFTKLSINA